MRIVCKLGGACIEDPELLASLLSSLASASRGHQLYLVHGGGSEIAALEKRLGIASVKRDGVRVTTDETLEAVALSLCGAVNIKLSLAARAAGLNAVGVCAGASGIFVNSTVKPGYGAVADSVECDPTLPEGLSAAGHVPVIAPLALGKSGASLLNFNADTAACTLARGLSADLLIMLSDIDGVMVDGAVIPALNLELVDAYIEQQHITGGMIPKIRAAQAAAQSGHTRVVIANGARADQIPAIIEGSPGLYSAVTQDS